MFSHTADWSTASFAAAADAAGKGLAIVTPRSCRAETWLSYGADAPGERIGCVLRRVRWLAQSTDPEYGNRFCNDCPIC